MSFQPLVPLGGYAGWRLLEQTLPRQRAVFESLPSVRRDADYFRDHAAEATTPAALVADIRLLKAALGAFGLGDDIGKKALIRRALEEGTERADAFANRLADPRWRAFAEAFGYGNLGGPKVLLAAFRERIASAYLERAFEESVGEVDPDMRLGLNFKREISAVAAHPNVDRIGWLQIMGQKPLRAVAEAALGIPSTVGQLDIDRQKAIFERRAAEVFGDASARVFLVPANADLALKRFFLRAQVESGPSASARGAAALALLTSAPPAALTFTAAPQR